MMLGTKRAILVSTAYILIIQIGGWTLLGLPPRRKLGQADGASPIRTVRLCPGCYHAASSDKRMERAPSVHWGAGLLFSLTLPVFRMICEIVVFLPQALVEGNKAQDVGTQKPKYHQITSDKVGKVKHPTPLRIPGTQSVPSGFQARLRVLPV